MPGRDAARSLEAWVTEGVLDASSTAGPAPEPSVRVETISATPRVRLLHGFVTADEAAALIALSEIQSPRYNLPLQAAALIALSEPLYHRSSTARATGDDKRTSFSATLPSSNSDVAAVRRRIARYSGYPEANLEPLQTVRYRGGEFYRPHHDFYNAPPSREAAPASASPYDLARGGRRRARRGTEGTATSPSSSTCPTSRRGATPTSRASTSPCRPRRSLHWSSTTASATASQTRGRCTKASSHRAAP